MKETYIEKCNREGIECLQGESYPEKAGLLLAQAGMLRISLGNVIEALEAYDTNHGVLMGATLSFNASAFINPNYSEPDRQYPTDRKLSTGEIKDGNTGELRDAPVHKSDLPPDLPTSNKGF